MTIGELARAAGVGVETIRFYERRGLVQDPPRTESGYRDYEPEHVRRVTFIRRAKELGFTLREIGELLDLRVHPKRSCAEVKHVADEKIADIEARVRDLRRVKRALHELTRACEEREATSECPILASLDELPG